MNELPQEMRSTQGLRDLSAQEWVFLTAVMIPKTMVGRAGREPKSTQWLLFP